MIELSLEPPAYISFHHTSPFVNRRLWDAFRQYPSIHKNDFLRKTLYVTNQTSQFRTLSMPVWRGAIVHQMVLQHRLKMDRFLVFTSQNTVNSQIFLNTMPFDPLTRETRKFSRVSEVMVSQVERLAVNLQKFSIES